MASFAPRLAAFRIYNDDGSESASTANAAQNTNITITDGAGNKNYLLRMGIQETGGKSGSNSSWQLQYSKNGGAYTNVTTTSSNVRAFDSANLTENSPTTQRLTGLTGTFGNGRVTENGGGSLNTGPVSSGNTEILYTVQTVDADLAGGDTLDFRVLYSGASLAGGYGVVPRITNQAVGGGGAVPRSFAVII